MVHSIELKFGMYIIDHRLTYCVKSGEFEINSFLQEWKKNPYILHPMESYYKRNRDIQTELSIEHRF